MWWYCTVYFCKKSISKFAKCFHNWTCEAKIALLMIKKRHLENFGDTAMLLCTKSICGSFTVINLVSYRSVCLDSVQTSMETGTTTGRRTIWPELSDTQESTMEITNIMSPCCWQTSTKSECLKADDTEPICAAGWPPNEPQQPFNVRYPPKEEFCFHFISLFYRFQRHFHYSAQPSFLSFTEVAV